MAEAIASGAMTIEGTDVLLKEVYDASLDDIADADAIVLGGSTYNYKLIKSMDPFLKEMVKLDLNGKVGVAFGSHGWSGEGVVTLIARMKSFGMRVVERDHSHTGRARRRCEVLPSGKNDRDRIKARSLPDGEKNAGKWPLSFRFSSPFNSRRATCTPSPLQLQLPLPLPSSSAVPAGIRPARARECWSTCQSGPHVLHENQPLCWGGRSAVVQFGTEEISKPAHILLA